MTSTQDISSMTREEIIAHNFRVVDEHFHNENPDDVDKAIALYGPNISWEAPNRGLVYTDPAEVKQGYLGIFRTLVFHKMTSLRRFATEDFVFDDMIAEVTVVGDEMPNLPYPIGTRLNMRLVHCFEMQDGKIVREIAYEMCREKDGPLDHDAIPEGSRVETFDDPTGS